MIFGKKEFGELLKQQKLDVAKFQATPVYESKTDSIILYWRDEQSYSKRLNERVTLFLSAETNEVIGVEIKGIAESMFV